MGGSQSKSTAQQQQQQRAPLPLVSSKAFELTPQFSAPESVIEKIRGLGDVIRYFNDNDMSAVQGFIDNYNQRVSAKEKIEVGPEIRAMLMNTHYQLLEVIDSQLVGASQNEKEQVLKKKVKDNKQLNDMLRIYYDKKLQDIEDKVMEDEAVRGNRDIQQTVRMIINNVKSLKVKYKFFEFKYLQLNLFVVVFVQFTFNMMTKFIVDVIAYNQARDAVRQQMTQQIFAATQQILGAQDLQLKDEDANAINTMISNLQKKVRSDQEEIQTLSAKLKNTSLTELVNFVASSDESLAAPLMNGVVPTNTTNNAARQEQLAKASQLLQAQQAPKAPTQGGSRGGKRK